jgi:hypothetical protein
MSPDELYLRYLKLKEVTFGIVPEDEWHKYYNDLLEVEKYLVFGNSIGEAREYPFIFTVENTDPIRKRATPLPKEARDWVN